jgi:transcriptional regulator EpsA
MEISQTTALHMDRPGEAMIDCARLGARSPVNPLQLTTEEGTRLLRIISRAALINRHQDIYLWLAGELQQFLPHQILVSAWGDFARGKLSFDVASGIPGVRTSHLARCRIDEFVRECHRHWLAGGRQPCLLNPADIGLLHACTCTLHAALRQMRSVLVHGVRDKRAGEESVYIALNSGFFSANPANDRWASLINALVAQIDAAFRKVAPFPLDSAPPVGQASLNGGELSRREREILAALACGKTNIDIAASLDISPYTVKNHVQRIFRKIGVRNRTQAATQYQHALRGG